MRSKVSLVKLEQNNMPEAKMLLEYMEKHNDEFLEVQKEAVYLETPTEEDKKDLEKCRGSFANLFSDIGFKCSVILSEGSLYGDHLLM